MNKMRAGRYELLERLGAGSIGVVFEAIDHRDGQRVALKQLRPLVPAGAYRLQREFEVLRGLRHPNIVQYFELYTDENPAFITMELIRGRDFVSYVRRQSNPRPAAPLPISDAPVAGNPIDLPRFSELVDEQRLRDVLRQLVPAVQTIHAAGVIHRDLKPTNVLVEDPGRVVVMDFSIATEARSHADEATSGGVPIGTPEYMAPEQAAGDSETPATDWYGLGSLMYVAITGRPPFEGPWNQVVEHKQAYDARPVDELVAGVPPDLASLCMDLLSRYPEKRPDAREICRRLEIPDERAGDTSRWVGLVPPFVARDAEMSLLRSEFSRANHADAKRGACVLVQGGPGMGKTRLLDEFLSRVHDPESSQLMVLRARCHPYDHRCYNGFEQVARQLSRELQTLSRGQLTKLLPGDRHLLPRMFSTFLRVAGIERPPRMTTSNLAQLRLRAIDALYVLLANLARLRPMLVIIDDIHWIDQDSVELLSDLFCGGVPARMTLLMAGRSSFESTPAISEDPAQAAGEAARWHELQALADHELSLPELSIAEQDELFLQMSGRSHADIGRSLPTRSGIPLLLLGRIQRRLAARSDDLPVMDSSLEELFAHQIRRLPGTARALLHGIAVMGSPASLSVLAKAVDQSIADRGKAVDALRTAGFVREIREVREPFLFVAHDEIRSAVLRELPSARRRELHQRLAMALQRTGNARSGILAAHWEAAGDRERAFSFHETAAKGARDRFAFHRAGENYRQAQAAVPEGSAAGVRLAEQAAQAARSAQRYAEAQAAYLRIAEQSGETPRNLHWHIAECALHAGDIDTALVHIQSQCRLLGVEHVLHKPHWHSGWRRRIRAALARRRSQPRSENEVAMTELQRTDSLQAMAMGLLLGAPTLGGNIQREQLLVTLRHGERRRMGRARCCELLYELVEAEQRPANDMKRAEQALHDAQELDDVHGVALAELCLGLAYHWRGQLEPAERRLQSAFDALTFHLGHADGALFIARFWLDMNALEQGHMRTRARSIARSVARAQRVGDRHHQTLLGAIPETWRLMVLDRVDVRRGTDGALDEATRLAGLADGWSPEWSYLTRCLSYLADALGHVYMSRAEPAERCLEQVARTLGARRERHALLLQPLYLGLHARVALLHDDRQSVEDIARRLDGLDIALVAGHSAALRAALAFRAGNRQTSATLLQLALEQFQRRGARHFAMATIYRQAQLTDPTQARKLYSKVERWCERQGIVNTVRMLDYLCPWSPTGTQPESDDASYGAGG